MHHRSIGIIASTIAGTVTGAFTAYMVTRISSAEARSMNHTVGVASQPPPLDTAPERPTAADPMTGAVVQDLQRRLAAVESRGDDAGAPGVGSAPRPEPVAVDHAEEHKAAIMQHYADRADPSWAPGARRSFENDLAAAGSGLGFDVRSVDCRTTSCLATVRFPTYEDAQKHWGDLLHMRYTENCGREILLDTPEDPSKAFETTVVFDCTGARAEGS